MPRPKPTTASRCTQGSRTRSAPAQSDLHERPSRERASRLARDAGRLRAGRRRQVGVWHRTRAVERPALRPRLVRTSVKPGRPWLKQDGVDVYAPAVPGVHVVRMCAGAADRGLRCWPSRSDRGREKNRAYGKNDRRQPSQMVSFLDISGERVSTTTWRGLQGRRRREMGGRSRSSTSTSRLGYGGHQVTQDALEGAGAPRSRPRVWRAQRRSYRFGGGSSR